MPTDDSELKEAYRELSRGMHKTGLAVHGLTVTQEAHGTRLSRMEDTVTTGPDSLQTRLARLEDRVKELDKREQDKSQTFLQQQVAKSQNKATVIAAYIGAVGAIIAVLVSIFFAASR